MKKNLAVGCLLLALGYSGMAAPMPQQFPYHGYYEEGGQPVTGWIGLQLQFFTNATDGANVYEDSNTVYASEGYFSTSVGTNSVSGSLSNALEQGRIYIQTVINGTNWGARHLLEPAAYALRADGVLHGRITSSMIASGAVQSVHIEQGAVTENKLNLSGGLFVCGIQLGADGVLYQDDGTTIEKDQIRFSGASAGGELVMDGETNLIVGLRQLLGPWLFKEDFCWRASNGTTNSSTNIMYKTDGALYVRKIGDTIAGPLEIKASEVVPQLIVGCEEGDQQVVIRFTADSGGLFIGAIGPVVEAQSSGVGSLSDTYSSHAPFSVAAPEESWHAIPFGFAEARYAVATNAVAKSGDTVTGPLVISAPATQTNLVIAGWAQISYIPPQGGLSMGTFTNGLPE